METLTLVIATQVDCIAMASSGQSQAALVERVLTWDESADMFLAADSEYKPMSGESQKALWPGGDDTLFAESWLFDRDSTEAAYEGFLSPYIPEERYCGFLFCS